MISGIKGDDYYAVWSMVHWNGGVLARTLSQKTTHLIVGANQSLVSILISHMAGRDSRRGIDGRCSVFKGAHICNGVFC